MTKAPMDVKRVGWRVAGLAMIALLGWINGSPLIAARTAATVTDPGWPRTYVLSSDRSVVMYQPQIASWDDQEKLVAWSALSYDYTGAKQPALGSIKFEANTEVSTEERLVRLENLKISTINFPTLSRDASEQVVKELSEAIPDTERVISLDRVLAYLDKSAITMKNADGVKSDPPKLFHSETPAIILNFDGTPIWSGIDSVNLKYVVNTNWDVLQDQATKIIYLRNGDGWLSASDVNGPWKPAGTLPASFNKLPADSNWSDVRANLPGKPVSSPPKVFVATDPAELILTDGPPVLGKVKGTDLYWVSNTESDVFRQGEKGAYYYLVAGRWFSAKSLDGPWTFATPSLPEDFKKIPLDHPRSRVLASVPGTDQAIEAVLMASIPTVARVNVKELKAPDVKYQGDPKFDTIPGTSVARAVNTDKDIIKVGDLYYMCFQAVWFTSRSPTGPWEVATAVPKEIYQIPPSSPSYNVTYVTVEESQAGDEWETFAYTAGYTGMMFAWGTMVWGTGWYYPPYYYPGFYPIYYPYPVTYGFGAWYNPYTGAYGRGARIYGPYGGAGYGAAYNPRTGTYARGAAAYGPYGARAAGQAYNPRTGTYAATRQGSNIYGNWGSSYVQRGDNWAQTAHKTNNATGTTTRAARGSEGGGIIHQSGPNGSAGVARGANGDIYAGKDGNVYRKQDGQWQKWDNGGWTSGNRPSQLPSGAGDASGTRPSQTPSQQPAGATGNLDGDRTARQNGNASTRAQGTYNGTRSAGGSYRPRMGGGGRRPR